MSDDFDPTLESAEPPEEPAVEAARPASRKVQPEDALAQQIELPPDIEEVWGRGRVDTFGRLARLQAGFLISEWGVEKFRASKVHALAQETLARDAAKAEARKMGMDDLPPEPEPM